MPLDLQQLREKCPELSDDLLGPMLNFLQVAREACGGDLELNIIMLAISIRTVAHPDFAQMALDSRLSEEPVVFPSRGVNMRSIAESSGVPRETVRRKVADLVKLGWVVRRGQSLQLTSTAFRALNPAREALEDTARLYYLAVERCLARGDRGASEP